MTGVQTCALPISLTINIKLSSQYGTLFAKQEKGDRFFFLLWSDRPYAKQFVCSTSFNTQKASPITILTLQIRKLRFSKVKLFAYDCNTSGGASLVTQMVKNLLAMWETQVQSLGWEDPLEKGMTIHSSILA